MYLKGIVLPLLNFDIKVNRSLILSQKHSHSKILLHFFNGHHPQFKTFLRFKKISLILETKYLR